MVNALSDVEGNILDCKKAIEEFDNELLQLHWDIFDRIQEQFKDLDSELSNLQGLFDDFKVTYTVKDSRGNIVSSGITLAQAQDFIKRKKAYAKGTRNAKGGLRVINEEGQELTLPKLSSGNYAIGNEGDQILTKKETDNVFEWAKITPEEFFNKWNAGQAYQIPLGSLVKQPEIKKTNAGNNVTMHYDSLVNIQGDVVDGDRVVKQIEQVANKAIEKSWHDVNMSLKYGSY